MLSYKESDYFYFKGFKLGNKYASFKINTDGVLLAAWSSLPKSKSALLDIGSGTGVITVIKALQNKSIIIDAIDIDKLSYEETLTNVRINALQERVNCYHTGLAEFRPDQLYDYIISNPPFYSTHQPPSNSRKARAKHNEGLSIQQLWEYIAQDANYDCTVALIYPATDHQNHLDYAKINHFKPKRICQIRGKEGGKFIRYLIEFTNHDGNIEIEESSMSIRAANGKDFSLDYLNTCKNYYLD
ncbi:MAG: methyltransferase [Saprospiraceae bacterium]|nr:methyltransferase [Saprospiraceae bacterium]